MTVNCTFKCGRNLKIAFIYFSQELGKLEFQEILKVENILFKAL